MKLKFIVDVNVGRLARRLRMLGYDALFINGADDAQLVRIALKENRVLLTKDNGIMQRRVVSSGKAKAVFIESDDVKQQLKQVVDTLQLDPESESFSICLECNEPLVPKSREEVRDAVPKYVYDTHHQFVQCPICKRVYWRGTHWEKMAEELDNLKA